MNWQPYIPGNPRTFPFEGTKVLVKLADGQIFRAKFFEHLGTGRFPLQGDLQLKQLPPVVEWAYSEWSAAANWSFGVEVT